MTHPADRLRGYSLKHLGVLFVNDYFCLTVFSYLCTLYFSAKYMRHKLCTIAETKYRNSQFKQFLCISR